MTHLLRNLCLLPLSIFLLSCHKPLTEVVIVIKVDDVIQSNLNKVELRVGPKTDSTKEIVRDLTPSESQFPVTLTVTTNEPDKIGSLRIFATFNEGGTLKAVSQRNHFKFYANERRTFIMELSSPCFVTSCIDPNKTCLMGPNNIPECVETPEIDPIKVDENFNPASNMNRIDASGTDAGTMNNMMMKM